MTPLLVRRTENKLSFSHSWWYSKLSAFSIRKKQKSHSLRFSTHFSLSNPSTTTQRLPFIIATHDASPNCVNSSNPRRMPEGILIPKEMSRRNVSDLSTRNSEDKTASLPLVRGPANQSRDQDSPACDDSYISIGLGECSLKDGLPLHQQLQNPAVHAAIHGQRCRANPIVQRQRWMRTFPLILKVVILKRSL